MSELVEVDLPKCLTCGSPVGEHWRGRPCLEAPPAVNRRDYPNLQSLAQGAVAGSLTEWPVLRDEAARALEEIEKLRKMVATWEWLFPMSKWVATPEEAEHILPEYFVAKRVALRQEAEIERLRRDHVQCVAHSQKCNAEIAAIEDAIDEVMGGGEWDDIPALVRALGQQINALRGEIEGMKAEAAELRDHKARVYLEARTAAAKKAAMEAKG